MTAQIVHLLDGDQPAGSYPAWLVPHLVRTGRAQPLWRWYADGMSETLPVGDLLAALAQQPQVVTVANMPEGPVVVAPVEVKSVGIPMRQVFNVTIYGVASVLIASPILAVLAMLVWTFFSAAITGRP